MNIIKTIEQVNSNLYGNPRFKVTLKNNNVVKLLRKHFDIRKVKNENAYYIVSYLTKKDLIKKVNTIAISLQVVK